MLPPALAVKRRTGACKGWQPPASFKAARTPPASLLYTARGRSVQPRMNEFSVFLLKEGGACVWTFLLGDGGVCVLTLGVVLHTAGWRGGQPDYEETATNLHACIFC